MYEKNRRTVCFPGDEFIVLPGLSGIILNCKALWAMLSALYKCYLLLLCRAPHKERKIAINYKSHCESIQGGKIK